MIKKLFSRLLGQPDCEVSEADKALADIRMRYPKPSVSQAAEIANDRHIAALRDAPHKKH